MAATVVAVALRVFVIEVPELAWACQVQAPPAWCPLRTGAILALRFGILGFAAVAVGITALYRPRPGMAYAAIGLGAAGLVLYAAEAASGGLLLGALALVATARSALQDLSGNSAGVASSTAVAAKPSA